MDDLALPLDRESAAALPSSDHKAELRLWLRLLTCSTLIENGIRKRLREAFDVTLPRFDLMAQLDKAKDGMTLGELSKRMMVSNGNITAIVDVLVAQGLLDRQAAVHDRRAQIVSLTPLGRETFSAMAAAHEDWIAEAFGDLTTAELDQLMGLLARAKRSAATAFAEGEN
ncbi:MAG: MarR family winged helix-turn-helix transcriptional regulator [Beijerinckiaceae bacterium]